MPRLPSQQMGQGTCATQALPSMADESRQAGGRYRWTVLAVGTGAQSATSAFFLGLPAIAPALRDGNELSLTGTALVLAAPTAGLVLTLLAWGRASDRFGDRAVMTVGLAGAATCLAGAAAARGPITTGLLLVGAGAMGASVNAGSGRAVLSWFTPSHRGVAMGVRQAAVPFGGAAGAATLPALDAAGGLTASFSALSAACALAAVAVWTWIREPQPQRSAQVTAPAEPVAEAHSVLRDHSLWRVTAASTLLVVPQFTLVTFTVTLLQDHRHLSPASAAATLAVMQVAGVLARLVVGHVSDRAPTRSRPLRGLAVAMAVGAVLLACCVPAPLPLLEVALVVEGALVISWNGLAYTAAGELAPANQRGSALAFQNTGNFVAATATPPLMSLVISAVGYATALGLLAAPATGAAALLRRPLPRRS
jgi:predicted MFS family arabinose efflux permease